MVNPAKGEGGGFGAQVGCEAGWVQGVRGHEEAVGVQRGEQVAGVSRADAQPQGAGQDLALGVPAVEQVEDRGGSFVGQLDQHRTPLVDPELQRAGTAPDAGEAGQQCWPEQPNRRHDVTECHRHLRATGSLSTGGGSCRRGYPQLPASYPQPAGNVTTRS